MDLDKAYGEWWSTDLEAEEWDEGGWKPGSKDARLAFAKGAELGKEDGAREEREAVVRALRFLAESCARNGDPTSSFLEDLALRVEAGEHRK